MSIIKRLSPLVANQIAAGEVIERPASVVKELLENAIDAQAKKIDVWIERGGVYRICIQDDGDGIRHDELHLAIAPHATSKIDKLSDLQTIASLGFRGEALASISSIAKLSILSKPEDQTTAFLLERNPMLEKDKLLPAAGRKGTTVEVTDLFYCIPARRKFLKKEKTEFLHIERVFDQLALSHFDIAFSLTHNQKLVKKLPAVLTTKAHQARVAKICGQSFLKYALNIDIEQNGMQLSGWVVEPEHAPSQAESQSFFINQRMVKDKVVHHAIREAYQTQHQPSYCLYMAIDPMAVDVNVHPAKAEVRFREPTVVHQFILEALKAVFQCPEKKTITEPTFTIPVKEKSTITYQNQALEACYDQKQPKITILSYVDKKLVIFDLNTEMFLLDPLRSFQALLKKLWSQYVAYGKKLPQEPLLVPQIVTLDIDDATLAGFNMVGFYGDRIGPQQILIRQVPIKLSKYPVAYQSLLSCLHTMQSNIGLDLQILVSKIAFCRPLESKEVINLIHTISHLNLLDAIDGCVALTKERLTQLLEVRTGTVSVEA